MRAPILHLLIAAGLSASPLNAAIIAVDSLADNIVTNGDCTLREAIQAANTNLAVDTCTSGNTGLDLVTVGLHGTIVLETGFFRVSEALSISGPGTDSLTIDGAGYQIFIVDMPVATHDFNIQSLTLRGGVGANGGALHIANSDRVGVNFVSFVANTATDGGAIGFSPVVTNRRFDTLVIDGCSFLGNQAANEGGAIGLRKLIDGEFPSFTSIHLEDSLFQGNSAAGAGGAVKIQHGGQEVTVESCTFADNHSTSSWGGGMEVHGDALEDGQMLAVHSSTLVGNSGMGGGGLSAANVGLRLTASTLVRNWATDPIRAGNLHVSTLEADRQTSYTAIGHSLGGSNCGGSFPIGSIGYNIATDGSCLLVDPTDVIVADLKVGGLGDWGGMTPTILPMAGSPMIDSADLVGPVDLGGSPITIDQRGESRYQDGDGDGQGEVDCGSVEVGDSYQGLFSDGFEEGSTAAWSGG